MDINISDLEAQMTRPSSPKLFDSLTRRRKVPRVTIVHGTAPASSTSLPIPPVKPENSQDAKYKPPSIFRPRAPISPMTHSGPVAITPRLPPIVGATEFHPRHVIGKRFAASPQPLSTGDAFNSIVTLDSVDKSTASASSDAGLGIRDVQRASSTKSPRKLNNLKDLEPYFEWAPSEIAATPRDIQPEDNVQSPDTGVSRQPARSTYDREKAIEHARGILEILTVEMSSGHYVSEDFPIAPIQFQAVKSKSFQEVDALLQGLKIERQNSGDTHKDARRMVSLKVDIVSSIDTILRCFIGRNNQDASLVQRIWGIVYGICQASDVGRDKADTHFKYSVLAWIKTDLAQTEQQCYEILSSARSDTGNYIEQLNFALPPSFVSQFRDIVLLLLSFLAVLLPDAPRGSQAAAEHMWKIVESGWTECEVALLRDARDFKENGDNREYLLESVKSADTMFALLLQNAFSISCSEMHEDDNERPHCDLEHIYRRWTTICNERANQEASAEMYEELRYLNDQLGAISKVTLKILEVRESPNQTLDKRINKRTETFLDDMIDHFRTLKNYAGEAETMTSNSIDVSNEGNNKAIFVFTLITIVFLPLNFISSILGMNTTDIRTTSRSSKLFWEIAVPFMAVVVAVCVILVKIKFKFKLRRRIGRFLLVFFPETWETEHMKIKTRGKQISRRTSIAPNKQQ
ncbi:uncharacterized protein AB675_7615 [Cyphellophora attinorum]|uniref:Magnesium transport protein CorA n=1 Tax=Cyphellophora attinorum TaxID=1664694 RepID=A0A0N0NML7_9EURO|nr:uncharacterized protein AB675_7615 [Phialophora attinorum]KPI40498.1 hypothetical protein AB675_7615 [Phialophora attinorum]